MDDELRAFVAVLSTLQRAFAPGGRRDAAGDDVLPAATAAAGARLTPVLPGKNDFWLLRYFPHGFVLVQGAAEGSGSADGSVGTQGNGGDRDKRVSASQALPSREILFCESDAASCVPRVLLGCPGRAGCAPPLTAAGVSAGGAGLAEGSAAAASADAEDQPLTRRIPLLERQLQPVAMEDAELLLTLTATVFRSSPSWQLPVVFFVTDAAAADAWEAAVAGASSAASPPIAAAADGDTPRIGGGAVQLQESPRPSLRDGDGVAPRDWELFSRVRFVALWKEEIAHDDVDGQEAVGLAAGKLSDETHHMTTFAVPALPVAKDARLSVADFFDLVRPPRTCGAAWTRGEAPAPPATFAGAARYDLLGASGGSAPLFSAQSESLAEFLARITSRSELAAAPAPVAALLTQWAIDSPAAKSVLPALPRPDLQTSDGGGVFALRTTTGPECHLFWLWCDRALLVQVAEAAAAPPPAAGAAPDGEGAADAAAALAAPGAAALFDRGVEAAAYARAAEARLDFDFAQGCFDQSEDVAAARFLGKEDLVRETRQFILCEKAASHGRTKRRVGATVLGSTAAAAPAAGVAEKENAPGTQAGGAGGGQRQQRFGSRAEFPSAPSGEDFVSRLWAAVLRRASGPAAMAGAVHFALRCFDAAVARRGEDAAASPAAVPLLAEPSRTSAGGEWGAIMRRGLAKFQERQSQRQGGTDGNAEERWREFIDGYLKNERKLLELAFSAGAHYVAEAAHAVLATTAAGIIDEHNFFPKSGLVGDSLADLARMHHMAEAAAMAHASRLGWAEERALLESLAAAIGRPGQPPEQSPLLVAALSRRESHRLADWWEGILAPSAVALTRRQLGGSAVAEFVAAPERCADLARLARWFRIYPRDAGGVPSVAGGGVAGGGAGGGSTPPGASFAADFPSAAALATVRASEEAEADVADFPLRFWESAWAAKPAAGPAPPPVALYMLTTVTDVVCS